MSDAELAIVTYSEATLRSDVSGRHAASRLRAYGCPIRTSLYAGTGPIDDLMVARHGALSQPPTAPRTADAARSFAAR